MPRPTMARSMRAIDKSLSLDTHMRWHTVAAMSRHAAVLGAAGPARSDAGQLGGHDSHRVWSGGGCTSDNRRIPHRRPEVPASQSRTSERRLAGTRVLVVDDDADVL